MLIDNDKLNGKLYERFIDVIENTNVEIITGYFTLSALNYLVNNLAGKVESFKFVIGDYIIDEKYQVKFLDLMNENLFLENALSNNKNAEKTIEFLKQSNVEVKTLEPNFCHAKAYLFENVNKFKSFYSIGSSNLTDAGLGLKKNNNIELNVFGQGTAAEYGELKLWFKSIWDSEKAKKEIKVDGKTILFKKHLINLLHSIYRKYQPIEMYYKILYHLWGDSFISEMLDPEFNKHFGKLENTSVYSILFDFQKKGVLSLIKMLQDYDGAILADAVGLGKTWTALSVIKFFEFKGFKTVVLSPKKLQRNWEMYLEHDNKFNDCNFKYKLRFHSDLSDNLWERYTGSNSYSLEQITNDEPKLIVIDESHNLRNDKSSRYKWFVEKILSQIKGEVKVLLLSATPINNSFNDIRNQFKLIVRDKNDGFAETLDVKNLAFTFANANKKFNEWRKSENNDISSFLKMIADSDFFRLTDSLIVARTRRMIMEIDNTLKFPKKIKPVNIRKTPVNIGNYESFEEIFDKFPPMMSAYQPSAYLNIKEKVSVLKDERQRDFFLVRMMYILMVKRLESSWNGFYLTVKKIKEHHQNAFDKILEYEKKKKDYCADVNVDFNLFDEDDEMQEEFDSFTLGKKRLTKLSDIDKAGKLELYKTDLKTDIESLVLLTSNLDKFNTQILDETNLSNNYKSKDEKLQALIEIIHKKRKAANNDGNQKILIFSVFKDTAEYLYNQLKKRGFDKIAYLSGSSFNSSYIEDKKFAYPKYISRFEDILEQFAPFGKMFNDKKWDGFKPTDKENLKQSFEEWKIWLISKETNNKYRIKLENPIEILIATDCLSEGQNLQDCDYVVNYDIHWNPVRVLQRGGRIDRLGSPNETIYSANFWPSDNINLYLNLEKRIEDRMVAMRLAGSEVDHELTDEIKNKVSDKELDMKQKEKMLRQLETTWDDIEVEKETIGLNDFSFDLFRQDLLNFLYDSKDKFKAMPNGVFSGFVMNEPDLTPGIVALFGRPRRQTNLINHSYKYYELIYIDFKGNAILNNQNAILTLLMKYKNSKRDDEGLKLIDNNDKDSILKLASALKLWFKNTSAKIDNSNDIHESAGTNVLSFIDDIGKGKKEVINEVNELNSLDEKFAPEYSDLITWIIINK